MPASFEIRAIAPEGNWLGEVLQDRLNLGSVIMTVRAVNNALEVRKGKHWVGF
jgi:hypothetical protein